MLLEHLLEVADVVDSVTERVHLGHLLVLGGRRDVRPEDVESAVDLLYPVSLPGISPGNLRGNWWGNCVTQRRVEGKLTFVVGHFVRCCCSCCCCCRVGHLFVAVVEDVDDVLSHLLLLLLFAVVDDVEPRCNRLDV